MSLGPSWKILQKNILPDFRSIESNFQLTEPDRIAQWILQQLDSNFTQKTYTLSKSKQDKQPVLIKVCQQYKLEF